MALPNRYHIHLDKLGFGKRNSPCSSATISRELSNLDYFGAPGIQSSHDDDYTGFQKLLVYVNACLTPGIKQSITKRSFNRESCRHYQKSINFFCSKQITSGTYHAIALLLTFESLP